MRKRRVYLEILALLLAGQAAARADALADLKKAFVALERSGDASEAARVAAEIGALDTPQAVAVLLPAGARTWKISVYEACATAFAGTSDGAVVDRIAQYLRSKEPAEACLAAEMLRPMLATSEKARDELLRAFLDLRSYPRSDAIQTIVLEALEEHRGETWALRALIDMRGQLLKRKIRDGRLYYGVVESLWDLTGLEYSSMADWEKYWEAQVVPGGWKPREKDARPPTGTPAGRTAVGAMVPSFFGRRIHSERALFIIDVSGSMEKVDPGQPPDEEYEPAPPPARKTVVPGVKKASREPDFGKPQARTRIQRVKRQLYRMVRRYPAGRSFAVLAYSTEVTPIVAVKKGDVLQPVLMDERTRQEALKKIVELEAEGLTRTDAAFDTAFRFEGVDTIYLLSDGYPQRDAEFASWPKERRQKVTAALVAEIIELVARKNRIEGRRWGIHTLGFPQAKLSSFLGQLARENYGEFSEVR